MQLNELQKGFFGYKEASVFQYIAALEEACALKIAEKDREIEKCHQQICDLEERLQQLKEGDKDLKIGLQKEAVSVENDKGIEEVEEKVQQQPDGQKWEQEFDRINGKLDQYGVQLSALQEVVARLLKRSTGQNLNAEDSCKRYFSDKNMTLFERKQKKQD